MKGKTLLSLAIVLSMVLALAPFVVIKTEAASPLSLSLIFTAGTSPTGTNVSSTEKGNVFNVTCNVANLPSPGIGFYTVGITWNASMIELGYTSANDSLTLENTTTDIVQAATGPYAATNGWSFADVAADETFFNDTDAVPVNTALMGGIAGYKGSGNTATSGALFTMVFTCIGVGPSYINITTVNGAYTYLESNPSLASVPITVGYNASIDQVPPPSHPPVPIITTPTNGETFSSPATVTLNGASSGNGYNALTSMSIPITVWNWTIVNSTGTYHILGSIVSITCTTGADTITLTVVAPPSDLPEYVDSASKTISILVVPPPSGPHIALYTARGPPGHEIGSPEIVNGVPQEFFAPGISDSYGPQELVTVYANVTSGSAAVGYAPVANKLVEFVVYLPNGTEIASYENSTDANGIAFENFRIPWEGTGEGVGGTQYFGEMMIYGTVSVANDETQPVQIANEVEFYYGWLLTINNITLGSPLSQLPVYPTEPAAPGFDRYPQTGPHLGDVMFVNVTVCSNMVYTPLPALVEVTASDAVDVPIGLFTMTTTVPPAGSNFVNGTLHYCGYVYIPSWAYVGTGTLYVDLLNSTLIGVPYCPQATASFIIYYP